MTTELDKLEAAISFKAEIEDERFMQRFAHFIHTWRQSPDAVIMDAARAHLAAQRQGGIGKPVQYTDGSDSREYEVHPPAVTGDRGALDNALAVMHDHAYYNGYKFGWNAALADNARVTLQPVSADEYLDAKNALRAALLSAQGGVPGDKHDVDTENK